MPQNGKPYILSFECGPTDATDQRNQGYTYACQTTFASSEDMKYYDDECSAHSKVKAAAKEEALIVPPLLVVYFTPDLAETL